MINASVVGVATWKCNTIISELFLFKLTIKNPRTCSLQTYFPNTTHILSSLQHHEIKLHISKSIQTLCTNKYTDWPHIAVVVRVHVLFILGHNQFEAFCHCCTKSYMAQHSNQFVYPCICLYMASHNKSFCKPWKWTDSTGSLHHRSIISLYSVHQHYQQIRQQ